MPPSVGRDSSPTPSRKLGFSDATSNRRSAGTAVGARASRAQLEEHRQQGGGERLAYVTRGTLGQGGQGGQGALFHFPGSKEYNRSMARGWESKSVEAQIDMAEAQTATIQTIAPSPDTLELIRKKENILLSRTRVVRDLDSAQNPRYKAVLTKALAELDAQLTSIAAV